MPKTDNLVLKTRCIFDKISLGNKMREMGEIKNMEEKNSQSNIEIDEAFEILRGVKFPTWDTLPELELYMDQVISLMERYLSTVNIEPKELDGADKIITPSMVNNYVKKGYMPAPIKKKYRKEHLAYLFIICTMKQSLPIPVIHSFIESMLTIMPIDELMDLFVESYKECFTGCIGELQNTNEIAKERTNDKTFQKAILAVKATAFANSGKIIGEIVNSDLSNK